MPKPQTKICTCCRKAHPLSNYSKNKSYSDGLSIYCKPCIRAKNATYRSKNPEATRANNLKSKFGLTLDEYDTMLSDQGGACAICGTDTPGGHGRFHVDHNHDTGENRGLLCHHCNVGLGHFRDSIATLSAAITYLSTKGSYGSKSNNDKI